MQSLVFLTYFSKAIEEKPLGGSARLPPPPPLGTGRVKAVSLPGGHTAATKLLQDSIGLSQIDG